MTDADLETLKAQLRSDESLSLKPADDAKDSIQIGYGRNLTFNGISLDEAELMLMNDVTRIAQELPKRWPPFVTLDSVRQQVLMNMTYNLGLSNLMLFTHTLAAIARGDYELAATDMLNSQWAKQVGTRANRLAKMMQTGELPT